MLVIRGVFVAAAILVIAKNPENSDMHTARFIKSKPQVSSYVSSCGEVCMFLDVTDEYSGNVAPWGRLNFTLPRISVRELIHERVRLEVERLGELGSADPATVDLTAIEKRLNDAARTPITSFILDDESTLDRSSARKQTSIAEKAFREGRYFVLLDDSQAESLDEMIDLARTTEVTFLLLTPLKGG
jgi:hypothetical protein